MNERITKDSTDKQATIRRRMFDKRRYKHIKYCIVDDPDIVIDTNTLDGVRELLECCMMLPHMQYDRRLGIFLMADIFSHSHECLLLQVTTYERYDTGFVENEEAYDLRPSDQIFKEIDDIIDKEWTALLASVTGNPL